MHLYQGLSELLFPIKISEVSLLGLANLPVLITFASFDNYNIAFSNSIFAFHMIHFKNNGFQFFPQIKSIYSQYALCGLAFLHKDLQIFHPQSHLSFFLIYLIKFFSFSFVSLFQLNISDFNTTNISSFLQEGKKINWMWGGLNIRTWFLIQVHSKLLWKIFDTILWQWMMQVISIQSQNLYSYLIMNVLQFFCCSHLIQLLIHLLHSSSAWYSL